MSASLRAWFRFAPVAAASLEAAPDGDLVRRFTDTRDDDAFSELVRRHGPMVLATCRRVLHPDVHTADDAFQAAFLVLATKAEAVSPPERVGAFLHGVAVHVAQRAKAWARKFAPSGAADLDHLQAVPNAPDPDAAAVRAQIDEVLAGLPAKYRAVVVLCDLEQRSRKEAAALLGWTEGALSGRLARARKLLADRLARRGVTVPVVGTGLGVLLPASAALASVPVQLAASTIRTAVLVSTGAVAGGAAGEAISASIAALAKGVPMHTTTFKLLAASAAGLGLALGGFGLYALTAADPPAAPAPDRTAPVGAPLVPAARAERGWTTKYTFTRKSAVTAVAFGPDLVASGEKSGTLILWDTKTGKEKETLLDGTEVGAKPIDRLQISPDGVWLYLVTNDGENFHQCSIEKKNRLFPGAGGNAQLKYSGATTDGKYWLRGFGDRVLELLENTYGENVIPFQSAAQFVHQEDITFAAAGEADVIATVAGGVLRRWDLAKTKPIWDTKLEKFEVSAIAVCPLTKVIAVGGKNGEVRVYAALTGKVLVTLTGHKGAVAAIGFNSDGTRIVTGAADKTARVWDAENGKELAVLKGHTETVSAAAFSPEGDMIVTGSSDKSVRVWSPPPVGK